jgi:hypothetical protein
VLFLLRGFLAWHSPRIRSILGLLEGKNIPCHRASAPAHDHRSTAIFVAQHKTSKKIHYDKFTAFHLWP